MKAESRQQWLDLQQRLARQGERSALALSVRIPGAASLWYGTLGDAAPCEIELARRSGAALDHALVYRSRPDVGAIIQGAGRYGQHVADFGGQLPELFDEQARHLGRMAPAVARGDALAEALAARGNVQLLGGQPLCLGPPPVAPPSMPSCSRNAPRPTPWPRPPARCSPACPGGWC